jgi:hypothetical protein
MTLPPLRDYQREAVNRALSVLQNGGGFGLWCEQRTGKTRIALKIAERLEPKQLIVFCPKVAIPVWKKAIKTSDYRPPRQILNWEALVNDRKRWYKRAQTWKDVLVICDESHCIKTRGAARSRTVRHLGRFAKYRLALSGTPIANGLQDAWAQYDFIDPEIFGPFDDQYTGKGKSKRLVRAGFDSTYLVWGGYKKHEIVRYQNQKIFDEKFHANSFRVTLREARKTSLKIRYAQSRVTLSQRSQRIYEKLQKELLATVNERKVKVKNVISCIVKLQQVTGGFVIGEGGPIPLGYEKVEKLHEIVRSLRARSRFVVIARFLWEIERIRSFLDMHGYSVRVVKGGSPYDGKFECDCIVMQIQSGVAVDMSQADTAILYSTDYSYLNFEQSRFRILSYEKEAAHYHFLLAENTIDVQIYEAITRKQNLASLIIDTYRTRGATK